MSHPKPATMLVGRIVKILEVLEPAPRKRKTQEMVRRTMETYPWTPIPWHLMLRLLRPWLVGGRPGGISKAPVEDETSKSSYRLPPIEDYLSVDPTELPRSCGNSLRDLT